MIATGSITHKEKHGCWDPASRALCYRAFWNPEQVDVKERDRFVHEWMQSEEEKRKSAPRFQEFQDISIARFIWRSITLEVQTAPDSPETVFSELLRIVQQWNPDADNNTNGDAIAATQDDDESWYAEGDGNSRDQWKRMLVRGLRVYKYLEEQALSGDALTSAMICQAHDLLMRGSKKGEGDGGSAIPAGEFRTVPVSAGDWTFPTHDDIPTCIEEIVNNFEDRLATLHAIEAATLLFYDVISLHPFLDGNGRLSRFLFGYALLRAGFPFPVILSSGASKEYKHYIVALRHAQGRGDFQALFAMAWESVERTLRNANDFL